MNTTNNTQSTIKTPSQDLDNNSSSNSFQDINKYNISLGQKILSRFLLLNQEKDFTLEEIERLSSITYKFTSSNTQIKSTEFKERELLLKEEAHRLKFHNTPPSHIPSKSLELKQKLLEAMNQTKLELLKAKLNIMNPNAPIPPLPHESPNIHPTNIQTQSPHPMKQTPLSPPTNPSTPPTYVPKLSNRIT